MKIHVDMFLEFLKKTYCTNTLLNTSWLEAVTLVMLDLVFFIITWKLRTLYKELNMGKVTH